MAQQHLQCAVAVVAWCNRVSGSRTAATDATMESVTASRALVVPLSLALACSSSSSPVAGTTADDDAGAEDAGLSSGESFTFNVGGGSVAINEESTKLADSLFDFDPTIDPTKTVDQNATAIGANIQMNLGSSCGTVSVTGADVTVSFGAPPGCMLTNGVVVSGAIG